MPRFVRSVLVRAPVEKVFAFHQSEDALKLLSPPFPPLKVIRKTGGIETGSRVELQIGPLSWVALHTAFEKDAFFEDTQIEGPFERWVHRHEFAAVDGGTVLTDCIDYRLKGRALTGAIGAAAVYLGLVQMFAYRHRITKRYCESAA